MNNFEQHLRANKKDYDLPEVNPAVWKGIKASGAKKTPRTIIRRIKTWRVPAAVVAVLVMAYLIWPKASAPNLSSDLLQEYGFESPESLLVAQDIADKLASMPVPSQYKTDHRAVMAALKALDERYTPVLENLKKEDATEFTQRQALTYYRKKVDLMTLLIKELSTLQNNEKPYFKDDTARPSSI